ncbi:hypothetical protein BGZ65_012735 [Modicella reniformis]|uniref:F-box domain-containing protein n=1 Tax=Modicella reniformis TaxID=1440133 RepID=A0A9P6MAE7_9FUNG|nr:hypothetical protein BGZ65_012735 [Modicella reniformis]
MASTHPHELPELILYIAAYVPLRCLPSCALVSKSWNQVFIPLIWRDMNSRDIYFGTDNIQRHRHLVKTIELNSYFLKRCASMRFPNLESLSIENGYDYPGFEKFISNHLSVSLDMDFGRRECLFRPEFLNKFLAFNTIKRIYCLCMEIDSTDPSSIWQLCTRSEQLELYNPYLSNFDQPSTMVCRIKELTIVDHYNHGKNYDEVLELMRRCPRLTTLHWYFGLNNEQARSFFPGLIRLLSEGTLPDLKSIFTDMNTEDELSSQCISAFIRSMKQIHVFCIASPWKIEPHHLELLRPHLDTITEMNLGQAADTTSAIAQQVLASCPMLERFKATHIYGRDVAKGQPWVCLRLRELVTTFIFGPSTIHHVQPLVFDQLSRLTRIENLTLYEEYYRIAGFQKSFDLRLECGLHKLATLRRLTVFQFSCTTQRMGMEEIEWMLKHWRSLSDVVAVLNLLDCELHLKLSQRLQEHGISHKYNFTF